MTIFSSARRASLVLAMLASACSAGDAGKSADAATADAGGKPAWAPASLTAVKGVPIATLRSAVTARLAGSRPSTVGEDAWQHARRLYGRYQQSPLWLAPDGLDKERAGDLVRAVLNANADAIAIDDYPIAEVANAIATVRRTPTPTAEQLADADVLLTATFASLGEDLLSGQVDPRSVSQAWHIDAKDENTDSALVRTLGRMPLGQAISAMRPQNAEYMALGKALQQFRAIAARGDWPRVPAGKAAKPGQPDAAPRLAALRARLAAEGITAPAAGAPTVYDAGLAGAVARFQARHGIAVDSALGTETVNALNVPVAYRLGQIAANMERHRWMPRSLPDRYVYVNVPAFHLEAFDGGKPTLEMKVIVGQEYEDKATPVFADSMETVVFRPYWNITPDIQAKEVGPKAAADPGYLAANDMEYYSDGGTQRIRQKPGPRNSLGFVKFLFPNDFNIYLHDTPNHELFEKDVRAFSHGCIRVEKPAELAQWALGWDAGKVQQAMQSGPDNTPVKVPRKIPVFIIYGTAYERDGQLWFGNDLYHRDDALVKAVATGAFPSQRAVQALEALKRIAEG
jgi:murein L,D-transpeptidase YcbB/YkuD